MKKLAALVLLAATAAFCSIVGPLRAGTLTLDPGSPSFIPPEAFDPNTIMVDTTTETSLIHLSGFATVTPPGVTETATVQVSGMFSADPGDEFSVAYRFASDLNADGPITYTISGDINGIPIPDITGMIDPGLHVYEGTAELPALVTAGTFNGTLTLDFANSGGTALPGTLDLTLQQLDFQLAPTPVEVNPPSEAQNISTRANITTGENVLIGGFIINGTDDKQVVVRGIGPSITGTTTPVLADPTITLFDASGMMIATNDNWMDLSQEDQTTLTDNNLAPMDPAESALVETLAPGEYTVIVSGVGDTTGIGLVEVYGLNDGSTSVLANISSRGFVETGDNVMIAGVILGGGGGGLSQLIVRGIGPSLADKGVTNPLADPMIQLIDANANVLATNDNWMDDPNMQQVSDAGLAPTDPNEAAIYDILPAGEYTAILSGVNDTSGIGLVEAYEIDPAPVPGTK
ncbi:MAG TPA: hypothetical protein VGK72_12865 [Chthoniobacterales bacterium]